MIPEKRYRLTNIQVHGIRFLMVGNRLRKILKREKVSAYQLSKDLGIDEGQLSRFFNDKCGLSIRKLERIAEYLGYDVTFVKHKPSRKGE